MPDADKARITRNVTDNVGRTLIEIYSGEEFVERALPSPVEGPGWDALQKARDDKRPMVLVTAHLGNYDAVRSKLSREGFPMAALYKPMRNPLSSSKKIPLNPSTKDDDVIASSRRCCHLAHRVACCKHNKLVWSLSQEQSL